MAEIKLPSNSITTGNAEKHEKKFEKVTTGKVVTKEKNDIQKVAGMFIAEDLKTVRDHIVKDVAIPSLKNVIVDLVWKTMRQQSSWVLCLSAAWLARITSCRSVMQL